MSIDWLGYREQFPTLSRCTYLNTCSLGPLARSTRLAVLEFLDLWEAHGATAWYQTWLGQCAALRQASEQLLNAAAGSVALAPSVGVALGSVASCYADPAGAHSFAKRPKVISTALDFPTLTHHWLARPDVELQILESDDGISVPLERYAAAIDERTALVVTSHVFFTSGYIQPISEIARLAHTVGAHVLIDGYQAAGQLPVDVQAADLDYYLCGGLKWLLGGPGIVQLYARPQSGLQPTLVGWFGERNQFAFDPLQFEHHIDARRLEIGTPALAAVYAALAGMQMILQLGPQLIRERQLELVADLLSRLGQAGMQLKIPANLNEHAGIVMVRAADPAAVVRALREQRILVDYRPGHVRISPYFFNSIDENAIIVAALRDLL